MARHAARLIDVFDDALVTRGIRTRGLREEAREDRFGAPYAPQRRLVHLKLLPPLDERVRRVLLCADARWLRVVGFVRLGCGSQRHVEHLSEKLVLDGVLVPVGALVEGIAEARGEVDGDLVTILQT